MTTSSHAVILAGGQGTRLRPYTTTIPKPLVPIGGDQAILEIELRQLAHQGFDRVTLAIGHLGDIIRAFVGDGSRWGIGVDYATELGPLGTMGPVVAIRDRLPEHFIVMNGDILTDLSYRALLAAHTESLDPLTIAACQRQVEVDFGVLDDRAGRVVGFTEKPSLRYLVSMGVYAVSNAALARYVPGEPLGFDRLVLDLIAAGTYPGAFAHPGYWLDIGRPDDYDRANQEFAGRRAQLLPGG